MATYRTKEGDMLDQICVAFYGQAQGFVEQVLDRNPRLANLGPLLPSNMLIDLPEAQGLQPIGQDQQVRLWD